MPYTAATEQAIPTNTVRLPGSTHTRTNYEGTAPWHAVQVDSLDEPARDAETTGTAVCGRRDVVLMRVNWTGATDESDRCPDCHAITG